MDKNLIEGLNKADNLLKNKKFIDANLLYQNLILNFPDSDEVYHCHGVALLLQNNTMVAIEKFIHATRINPDNAFYKSDLGELYRRVGMMDMSIKYNLQSFNLNPKIDSIQYNLGIVYLDKNEFDKAITHFKKTIEINPNHNLAWNNLGTAYEKQEKIILAHEAYKKSVELNPNNLEALNNLGTTFSQFNKIDEAVKLFNNAINLEPNFFGAHFNLSPFKKYTKEDPHFKILEKKVKDNKPFNILQKIRFHFTYGKALYDVGEYDLAFLEYKQGNEFQSKLTPYNKDKNSMIIDKIMNTFNINFINKFKQDNSTEIFKCNPIFILGMPRSGTSLIEQIIDCNNSVYGAGELKLLIDCLEQNIDKENNKDIEKMLDSISKANDIFIKKIGNDYLTQLSNLSPNSKFISDKMPGNFLMLGLIFLAIPNAKVIHVTRDPMDCCFSNFIHLYNDDMRFSYSQDALGNYYKDYHKIMMHWKKVLPNDFIYNIKYENLINNTEKEIRQLNSFLDIEWDPKCLKFYNNKRNVKTASKMEVNKPIYKTSISKWKKFSEHLNPLYDIIKPYVK